jgi:Flp pilus assembly protein TadD
MSELRMAVSLDPDSPLAHHYLGTALYEAENFAAAITEFREAVRLEPTGSNHYHLAACLMSMGRYAEALTELETAARLEPGKDLYRARKEELLKVMKNTSVR